MILKISQHLAVSESIFLFNRPRPGPWLVQVRGTPWLPLSCPCRPSSWCCFDCAVVFWLDEPHGSPRSSSEGCILSHAPAPPPGQASPRDRLQHGTRSRGILRTISESKPTSSLYPSSLSFLSGRIPFEATESIHRRRDCFRSAGWAALSRTCVRSHSVHFPASCCNLGIFRKVHSCCRKVIDSTALIRGVRLA